VIDKVKEVALRERGIKLETKSRSWATRKGFMTDPGNLQEPARGARMRPNDLSPSSRVH